MVYGIWYMVYGTWHMVYEGTAADELAGEAERLLEKHVSHLHS